MERYRGFIVHHDYPDIVEPAFIRSKCNGAGEMAYGALTAYLAIVANDDAVDLGWSGSDEGDEVAGDGWAEIQPDGSVEAEIAYKYGDETTFKPSRGRLVQHPARGYFT